jgi:hypoxanthine-guanine phosphoribosyltransferase
MYNYPHKDFVADVDKIIEYLEETKSRENIHLIAPMFGALPIATRMRNLMKYKISLVKMSRYFGDDKKATWIYEDEISVDDELIIVDDLYDSGETFKQTMDLVRKSFPKNKVRAVSLFGKKLSPSWLWYVNEAPGEWIKFESWE